MIRAVKIVNYIRDRVLHLRLFEAHVSIAAQNRHLIFHSEVIWLWEGRAFAFF